MDRRFPRNMSQDLWECGDYLDVKGVHLRREAVTDFIDSELPVVMLERDTLNEHDPNAIRLVGVCKSTGETKRLCLGFVDRVTARRIVLAGLCESVRPWLRQLKISESGYISIRYDLLLPSDQRSIFENACRRDALHFTELRAKVLRDSFLSESLIGLTTGELVISDPNACLLGRLRIPDAHLEEPFVPDGQINLWEYDNNRVLVDLSASPPHFYLVDETFDDSEPVSLGDSEDGAYFWLFGRALVEEELHVPTAMTRTGRPKGFDKADTDPDKPKLIDALALAAKRLDFKWLPQTVTFWQRYRDESDYQERLIQIAALLSKCANADSASINKLLG